MAHTRGIWKSSESIECDVCGNIIVGVVAPTKVKGEHNEEDERADMMFHGGSARVISPHKKEVTRTFKLAVDVQYASTSETLRLKELELATVVAKCEFVKLQCLLPNGFKDASSE